MENVRENLQILDCTLRDGGYCNEWRFGESNIKKIINNLINSSVEIIECGFLTDRVVYDEDVSKYTNLKQLEKILPQVSVKSKFVVMMNYGEYDVNILPECKNSPIDGIRIAFHKKNIDGAIRCAETLAEKGYLVFIQPMVTLSYSDKEFIELIEKVNTINPYAFYVVDSFGTMKERDVMHYWMLCEDFINQSTIIGFHSHNNLQLSLSNSISIIESSHNRQIIIDASVYGMGRGAGNLNTELFLNELNAEYGGGYKIKPLLQAMDEIINRFYEQKPWGYSLPNYLSAIHMIHPSYSMYLCEKKTMTLDALDDIFSMIDKDKAVEFDSEYIERLYYEYMAKGQTNEQCIEMFKEKIYGRKVLLVASGRTTKVEKKHIAEFVLREKPVVISINHEYKAVNTDFIFVSNMRRFRELPTTVLGKALTTTNISAEQNYASFDYYSLVNPTNSTGDNAGLMAIQLLINLGCSEVYLAGYDGYEYSSKYNYENSSMELYISEDAVDELNNGMKSVIEHYSNEIDIHFITKSRFTKMGNKL